MKVLMMPDYSRFNPYQRELVSALEKYGVQVTLCSFNIFPLLRSLWVHGKPDVLHLHWTDGYIITDNWIKTILKTLRFFVELLFIKIIGVRIVWTVHNLSNHEKNNSSYESFINRILVHLYDRLIVHCLAAGRFVTNLYHLSDSASDKIRIIPHGNYVNCYPNNISTYDARERLGYGNEEIIFLFFGSIRPYKGLFDLIEAFIAIKNPKARLLIVGKTMHDTIKDELLLRCQNDARICAHLHYIDDNDVQIYMNAANVTVFPYTDILTSGSVLLAMSFGKAIIVPQIGCVPETLDPQGGFLYNPQDVYGLSKAIENALHSDLNAMSHYNRMNVEKYNWDKIAQMTSDVYSKSFVNK